MQSKILLLIFSLVISYVSSCTNGHSSIIPVLRDVEAELPKFIQDLRNMTSTIYNSYENDPCNKINTTNITNTTCPCNNTNITDSNDDTNKTNTSCPCNNTNTTDQCAKRLKKCDVTDLIDIYKKGYKYWSSLVEERLFKGILSNKENLEALFSLLLDSLPIDKNHSEKLLPLLSEVKLENIDQVLGFSLLYNNKKLPKKGWYNSFFIEKSCSDPNNLNILTTGINIGRVINKDIFMFKQGEGNLFEGDYKDEILEVDEDLCINEYNVLMKLLQTSIYANSADLIEAFDDF